MKLSVTAGDKTIVFTLNDSPATKALYGQLPLNVAVESFSSNEKIFYPPEILTVTRTPLASTVDAGTLAYYAPWGNVVMFYDSFHSAPGLYALGHATAGTEYIQKLSGKITINVTP